MVVRLGYKGEWVSDTRSVRELSDIGGRSGTCTFTNISRQR